jgi:cytoskeletal protein RodZ
MNWENIMNKNKLGAAIAVAGIAGAFGVKLYSQYKLLKGDEETETQDTTSEAENVSTEDLDNFDFESIVNEKDSVSSEEQEENPEEPDVTIENLEPDTNNVVDITEELLSSIDEVTVEVAPEVVSQEETKEESEEPKKEESYDSSMSAYKDQDIKDPSFWNKFDDEMKDK